MGPRDRLHGRRPAYTTTRRGLSSQRRRVRAQLVATYASCSHRSPAATCDEGTPNRGERAVHARVGRGRYARGGAGGEGTTHATVWRGLERAVPASGRGRYARGECGTRAWRGWGGSGSGTTPRGTRHARQVCYRCVGALCGLWPVRMCGAGRAGSSCRALQYEHVHVHTAVSTYRL